MTLGNEPQEVFEKEAELAAAEADLAGPLNEAAAQIAPRPEFAAQLEARLLAMGQATAETEAQPTTQAPTELQLQSATPQRNQPRSTRPGLLSRILGSPATRFAMTGVVLGVAVVSVFLLSFLFVGNEGASPVAVAPVAVQTNTGSFVPPGKVRHLVISETLNYADNMSRDATPHPRTQDIWYTNGSDHLLMYSTYSGEDVAQNAIWVEEQAVYTYWANPDNFAYKFPYNPRYAAIYGPDPEILTNALKLIDAAIVGKDTLNGHPVTIVEGFYDKPEKPAPATPTNGESRPAQKRVLWIDTQEHRLLKIQYITIYEAGKVEVDTAAVVVDELKDASEFPADFFKFKLPTGATLIEGQTDPLAGPPRPVSTYSAALATEPAQTPRTEPTSETVPHVGSLAPDFELPNVRPGKPAVRLSSLRGKPVLLNFWGTSWCQPCFIQMGAMETMYFKYSGQVEFVGVSMGPRDTPDYVNTFADPNHFTWIFVHDADSSVMNRYKITGLPSSYFIDKDGIIRAIFVGGADAQTIEDNLQLAMAATSARSPQAEPPTPIGTVVSDVFPAWTPLVFPSQTPSQAPPRIPLAEFKALYDDPAKRLLIIDVRAKESYDAGHIKGAISFPEADVDVRVMELPKDRLVIAYCQ